jgi:hypothetical protein
MPDSLSIAVFVLVLLLPIVISIVISVVPSIRKDATDTVLGNPLHNAPLAPKGDPLSQPYVHLTRVLDVPDLSGYILGLRHLPIAKTAPILERHVHGSDPALQLYAQSILQQGQDDLQLRFQQLLEKPATDSRMACWLLETGLTLASPTLNSQAERVTWLERLVSLATDRLSKAPPTPGLIAAASRIFLAAGHPAEASRLAQALPPSSPLATLLQQQSVHALHQQRLN